MGFLRKNGGDLTRKTIILDQVKLTNRLISGFDSSPEAINAAAGLYDAKRSSQEGKKIALAILTLRLNITDLLPPLFYEKTKETEKVLFAKKNYVNSKGTPKHGFQYLDEDTNIQFAGIIELMTYYGELLNALFSLPEFRDVHYDYAKEEDEEPKFPEN